MHHQGLCFLIHRFYIHKHIVHFELLKMKSLSEKSDLKIINNKLNYPFYFMVFQIH